MRARDYDATAISQKPWERADDEGNPQAYTYAARPDGPFSYTRAELSRVLRDACAEQAEEDRNYRLAARFPSDLETFRGMH